MNPTEAQPMPTTTAPEKSMIDQAQDVLRQIPGILAIREVQAGLLCFAAICFAFFPLLALLPKIWLDFDSYYAHGLLIPFASAWIIASRWSKIKDIPVKGSWAALIVLLPTLYLTMIASRTVMPLVLSVAFIATILATIWFVAGFKWTIALAPAVLFLLLGLPVLDRVVDNLTFKLQLISTTVAETMLKLIGYNVLRLDQTVLHLDNFDLNIAGACSGLKTTIAVSASVVFFMLITPLRWWANLILATIAVPLSVVVNGLRIAMIGVVGNTGGADAGMKFHDYSGYIALGVCFFTLFKLTQFLEDRS